MRSVSHDRVSERPALAQPWTVSLPRRPVPTRRRERERKGAADRPEAADTGQQVIASDP